MATKRLPASFTGLYRLFLRTCSASVLHHRVGTRNLRRLWRPTFDVAANVTRQLENNSQNNLEQAQLEEWLHKWEQRIDGTLALLYNSSQSRGLPHKLTRNLGLLVTREQLRLNDPRPMRAWEPQIRTSPSPPKQRDTRKEEKQKAREAFEASAWAPLSQVVKLAEGRDGISLGRLALTSVSRRRPR
ncbi:hypothetical protein Hypma_007432 [Hypsizygus marmoreus]|uniref:Uncharacterized protein n=1 Tax=Hypsizygus marmoreus TaxID=39966 RepID=A0A369JWG8_HYPMA|nr:hypothetical protein Hypma_007432 [Hypsizygus marmoreus]